MRRAASWCAWLCLLIAAAAPAHEVRPAYLLIQQTGAEQFEVHVAGAGAG